MRETVEWLGAMEGRAARLYERLSEAFKDDPVLSGLFKKLADDETLHRRIMEDAMSRAEGGLPCLPAVDDAARGRAVAALSACERAVEQGSYPAGNPFGLIIDLESSELNPIFLGVINTLKAFDRSFVPRAAKIARHMASLDRFVRLHPGFERDAGRLEAVPRVWRERILVVQKDEFVAEALKAALACEGEVERAGDGRQALRMMGERYYAAVVADVEMQAMDGMEFLERAKQVFPGVERRMLFLARSPNEKAALFAGHKAPRLIAGPESAESVRRAVADILDGL